MRKFFAMLLALVMALSLAACGGGSGDTQPSGGSGDAQTSGGDKVVKIGVFEPATGDSGAGGDRKSVV